MQVLWGRGPGLFICKVQEVNQRPLCSFSQLYASCTHPWRVSWIEPCPSETLVLVS